MADEENWVMLEEQEPTERKKMFSEAHKKATERIQQFEERVLTVIRARSRAVPQCAAESGPKEEKKSHIRRQMVGGERPVRPRNDRRIVGSPQGRQ